MTAYLIGSVILAATVAAFRVGFHAGRNVGRSEASEERIVLTEIEEMTRGY